MRTDDELDALGVPLHITPPESWHWVPQPSLEDMQGALIDDDTPVAALLSMDAPSPLEGQPVAATEEAAPPEPARGRGARRGGRGKGRRGKGR